MTNKSYLEKKQDAVRRDVINTIHMGKVLDQDFYLKHLASAQSNFITIAGETFNDLDKGKVASLIGGIWDFVDVSKNFITNNEEALRNAEPDLLAKGITLFNISNYKKKFEEISQKKSDFENAFAVDWTNSVDELTNLMADVFGVVTDVVVAVGIIAAVAGVAAPNMTIGGVSVLTAAVYTAAVASITDAIVQIAISTKPTEDKLKSLISDIDAAMSDASNNSDIIDNSKFDKSMTTLITFLEKYERYDTTNGFDYATDALNGDNYNEEYSNSFNNYLSILESTKQSAENLFNVLTDADLRKDFDRNFNEYVDDLYEGLHDSYFESTQQYLNLKNEGLTDEMMDIYLEVGNNIFEEELKNYVDDKKSIKWNEDAFLNYLDSNNDNYKYIVKEANDEYKKYIMQQVITHNEGEQGKDHVNELLKKYILDTENIFTVEFNPEDFVKDLKDTKKLEEYFNNYIIDDISEKLIFQENLNIMQKIEAELMISSKYDDINLENAFKEVNINELTNNGLEQIEEALALYNFSIETSKRKVLTLIFENITENDFIPGMEGFSDEQIWALIDQEINENSYKTTQGNGDLYRKVINDYYDNERMRIIDNNYDSLITKIENILIEEAEIANEPIDWGIVDNEIDKIWDYVNNIEPPKNATPSQVDEFEKAITKIKEDLREWIDDWKEGDDVSLGSIWGDISDAIFGTELENLKDEIEDRADEARDNDSETKDINDNHYDINKEDNEKKLGELVDLIKDITNNKNGTESALDDLGSLLDYIKSIEIDLKDGDYYPEFDNLEELISEQENIKDTEESVRERRRDPLVFDLNGDGVRTVGLEKNVYFDHSHNGFKENTGWADSKDGTLVFDINNNGIIDSGRELFGDNTIIGYDENNNPIFAKNGFEALAVHDENNDGIIDANDSIYNKLNIWVDRNFNGRNSDSEMYTLKEANIKSINLSINKEGGDAGNGNSFIHTGSYTTFDNENLDYASLNYVVDNSEGEFSYDIELSEESEAMPWVNSFGRVRNFKEATTLDPTLIDDINNFSFLSTRKERFNAVDKILYKWVETSTFDNYKERYIESNPEYFGSAENLTKFDRLAISEAFAGRYITDSDPESIVNAGWGDLDEHYSNIKSYVFKSLNQQIFFKDYDGIIFEISKNIQTYQNLEAKILNENISKEDLSYLALSIKDTYPITLENWDVVSFVRDSIYDGIEVPENLFDDLYEYGYIVFDQDLKDFDIKLFISENIDDFVNHMNKEDFQNNGIEIIANDLDNKIKASLFNDNISSGKGNDVVFAYEGDDIIYGNEGDDIIYDGKGDDTIIYNLGDGNDTIHLSREDNEALTDKLILGTGITLENITFGVNGDNLVLSIVNGNIVNTLTINGWFDSVSKNDNDHLLKYIEFVDGGILTTEAITKLAYEDYYEGDELNNSIYGDNSGNIINGNGGNDKIYGREGDDIINGGNDNDRLYGNEGNDILNGGDGKDLIYGEQGNDILTGGNGNDTLNGGYGANILDGGEGDDSLKSEYNGLENSEFLFNSVQNTFIGGKGDDKITDGYHSDLIIYNLGDGHDTISINDQDKESGLDQNLDLSTLSEKNDILRFGDGINIQDLSFRKNNQNLIIEILKGTANEGSIEISNWFKQVNTNQHKIELFEFNNGDVFTWKEINEIIKANLYNGTEGQDNIESIEGLESNINTGIGNDYIFHSQNFNIDINAGKDNDDIYIRNDSTIFYNLGDGDDEITINKNNELKEQIVNLKFGHGINQDDITFELKYSDLILYIHKGKSYEGKIIIDSAYSDIMDDNYIEKMLNSIEFSNGKILNINDINKILKDSIYNKETSNVDSDYQNNVISEYESISVYGLDDRNNIIRTGDLDNNIYGKNGNDIIYGGGGNDHIKGGTGSDYLDGGDGNDTIEGSSRSSKINVALKYQEQAFFDVGDTLVGGKGNDNIIDSYGSDTIIYNLGDGHDTMELSSIEKNTEYSWINKANDKIVFGEGITKESLSYEVNSNDLILFINKGLENEGSMTFDNWFVNSVIEEFHFKDGTVLYDNDISSEALNSYINGTDGNDTIYAEIKRNNIINAGLGDDTINDSRDFSSNTFIYNIGDGNDTIIMQSKNNSNGVFTDKLVFGEGITENDLSYYLFDDNDLKIVLFEGSENEGSITFTDFLRYDNKNYKIEEFHFKDGTILNWESVYFKAFEYINGSNNNDGITGSNSDNIINGFDGSDSLYGQGGDDTIYGGDGNDKIYGRDDNDVLYGDSDDDRLYGGDGNDILNGGTGNDDLYGDNGNDILNGGDGNDEIQGGYGKDILNGGAGNDKLGYNRDYGSSTETNLYLDNGNVYNGGVGNDTIYDSYHSDTIIYNLGDGDDKIYMSTYEENLSGDGKSIRQDKLVFGEGITIDDILFKKSSRDLVITIHDGTENEGSINFDDWFSDEDTSIEKIEIFEFSNGETYTWEDINNHINGVADITTQYDLLAQEMASFGSGAEDTINDSNVETRESHFYVEM